MRNNLIVLFSLILISCGGIIEDKKDGGTDATQKYRFVDLMLEDQNIKLDIRPRCGDHICNGNETWRTCWYDCTPQPYNPEYRFDPGWIDPVCAVEEKQLKLRELIIFKSPMWTEN